MDCPICLENLINKECIIVDCNHIFHKKCIYYANKDKSENRCSLCRSNITIPDITKISKKIILEDSYVQSILTDIVDLMDGKQNYEFEKILYTDTIQKSWFILGSFALFLYKRIIEEKCDYNHNYSDIDIYTFQDYINFNKKFICLKNLKNTDSDKLKSDLIEYIKTINFTNLMQFSRIKTLDFDNQDLYKEEKIESVLDSTSQLKIDFIKIQKSNTIKETLIKIFKTFTISCCKIAVRIVREDENIYKFKFYIDKSFYYNTYKKVDKHWPQTVKKYKFRGFDLTPEE